MARVGQKLNVEGSALGQVVFPTVDGLTAHAGGGQGSATPLPFSGTGTVRFTTVATAGDSTILPAVPSTGNQPEITIVNAGAASMNVFPPSGGQINNAGANVAFALAAGKVASFFAISGVWHAMLSA